MRVYPAIDLMEGEAVRLERGKRDSRVVYGDPLEFAREFSKYVDRIHVVDLDGAFSGDSVNLAVVQEIIEETDLEVQMGGGLRTIQALTAVVAAGVEYPIIGTKALDGEFVSQAVEVADGLTVSLDVKDGEIAAEGWVSEEGLGHEEVYWSLKNEVNRFIVTAISRDGTMSGPEEIEKFWDDEEVLYAGGVSTIADVRELESLGYDGAIVGKAVYEGGFDLAGLEELSGGN